MLDALTALDAAGADFEARVRATLDAFHEAPEGPAPLAAHAALGAGRDRVRLYILQRVLRDLKLSRSHAERGSVHVSAASRRTVPRKRPPK
jgi:hypothetical protein